MSNLLTTLGGPEADPKPSLGPQGAISVQHSIIMRQSNTLALINLMRSMHPDDMAHTVAAVIGEEFPLMADHVIAQIKKAKAEMWG